MYIFFPVLSRTGGAGEGLVLALVLPKHCFSPLINVPWYTGAENRKYKHSASCQLMNKQDVFNCRISTYTIICLAQ